MDALDLAGLLKRIGIRKALGGDRYHLSPDGHAAVAEAIAEWALKHLRAGAAIPQG